MSEYLPKEVRDGLAAVAYANRKRERLRVRAGGRMFTLLRYSESGITVERENAPHMRGHVDVFDGARHLSRCLVVLSAETDAETSFEFKRRTMVSDTPPLDYERDPNAPVALIGHA